jgi:hypothetical protein
MVPTKVVVKDLPYEVVISKENHKEAAAWCRERLGPRWEVTRNRKGIWCCFWEGFRRGGDYRYHFQNDKDAVLFVLRWSS